RCPGIAERKTAKTNTAATNIPVRAATFFSSLPADISLSPQSSYIYDTQRPVALFQRIWLRVCRRKLASGTGGCSLHVRILTVSKQVIHPAKALSGGVQMPGDKSISHRYAMLAALAEGTSELRNFAAAADCHSTLACMKALGADVKVDNSLIRVTGHGLRGLKSSWRALDAGNSGTTIRLLSGILAGQDFKTTISGDESLEKRPMKRVVGPLREMGAEIKAREDNFAPLEIRGGNLRAIDYKMPIASAQVKSAVLLAGLFAEGGTIVTEPART